MTSLLTGISHSQINLKTSLTRDDQAYTTNDAIDNTDQWYVTEEKPVNTVLSNVTNATDFDDGLKNDVFTVPNFQKIVKGRDQKAIFSFIAKNTNPNKLRGMINNIFHYFSSGALNKNCIICSKAVEKNLALLEKGQIDCFWVAESTQPGWFARDVSPQGLAQFTLKTNQLLSEQLLTASKEGNRYIISVPLKGKGFAHAMNLVRTGKDDIVIDGQFGLTYNLSLPHERKIFDSYYGKQNNDAIRAVQIYMTGNAPYPVTPKPDINELIKEWVIISPDIDIA